ncbi:MAG: hypothetical protein JWQ87_5233 [Candidatus Sulfotelmatobacter sp.]|nr:hypothetical protein [Candidatus Sulfotelmatobacter sp.]
MRRFVTGLLLLLITHPSSGIRIRANQYAAIKSPLAAHQLYASTLPQKTKSDVPNPTTDEARQQNEETNNPQGQEITVGARVWKYDRVYPLLDGLFEDVVSSQVAPLLLNNNSSNASKLDAVVQSLQIQAGYGQLAGVQNSVASQMAVANLGYQSVLAQQSQSILQQQLSAQQQLYQAKEDQANAQANKDTAAQDIATKKVQAITDNINNLSAQMALVKAPSTPWTPSPATGSIANPTTAFSSAVPATTLSTGTVSGGPTFPATKQLDNQVDLLWSRLARVVGAMAQPDSAGPDDRLYLIEFSTATFPKQAHQQHLLDTTYDLSCPDNTSASPTVVDVFPRVAALNITDTRYKDQAFNLGAVLSFLGFGVNASYNREHLQMTQLLGQSSYITGYGVGQSHFGWKFGIPLGDKIISSDIKKTFALIRVPIGCNSPIVSFDKVWWAKPKHTPRADSEASGAAKAALTGNFSMVNTTMSTGRPDPPSQILEGIDFNRTAYDPAKYSPTNPVLVSLVLRFSQNLDPQILVYANGVLIKRARDTFGRAVSLTTAPGLLETNSLTNVNTWMPTSAKSIIVNLDGGQFGQSFPTIMIVPPSQAPIAVGPSVSMDATKVTVSGKPFHCNQVPCALPSIAYKQTTFVRINAARWQPDSKNEYKVIFTVRGTAPVLSTSSAANPASVQLVTSSEEQIWGTNSEVYAVLDGSDRQERLQCDPTSSSGARLVCNLGPAFQALSLGNKGTSSTAFITDPSDPAASIYALSSGALPDGITLTPAGALSGTPKTDGLVKFTITATGNVGGAGVTKNRSYIASVGSTQIPPQPTQHMKFHILDMAHSGTPVEGWTELAECGDDPCTPPTIWSVDNPQWSDGPADWEFTVRVVNVDPLAAQYVHINTRGAETTSKLLAVKNSNSPKGVFSAKFTIAQNDILRWYDSMDMTVDGSDARLKLLNIHDLIAPVVSYISPDSTSWSGQNFTRSLQFLEVGASTKGIKISCPSTTACTVDKGAAALPTKQSGILYLASSDNPSAAAFIELPLMKLNSNGTLSPISYQPPKSPDQPANAQVVPNAQTSASPTAGLSSDANNQSAASPGATVVPTIPKDNRVAAIAIQ